MPAEENESLVSKTGGGKIRLVLKKKAQSFKEVVPSQFFDIGESFSVVKDGVFSDNFIHTKLSLWPIWGGGGGEIDPTYEKEIHAYVVWAYYRNSNYKRFNGGLYVDDGYKHIFTYVAIPDDEHIVPERIDYVFSGQIGDINHVDKHGNEWEGYYHPYCSVMVTNSFSKKVEVITPDGGSFILGSCETREVFWYAETVDETVGGIKIRNLDGSPVSVKDNKNTEVLSTLVDGWYLFPVCPNEIFVNRNYIDISKYNLTTSYSKYSFRPLADSFGSVWWMRNEMYPYGWPDSYGKNEDTTIEIYNKYDRSYNRFNPSEVPFFGCKVRNYDTGGGPNNYIYGGCYVFLGNEGDENYEGSELFVRFQYRDMQPVSHNRVEKYELRLSQNVGEGFRLNSVSGFEWLVTYIPLCRVRIVNGINCEIDVRTPDGNITLVEEDSEKVVEWYATSIEQIRGMVEIRQHNKTDASVSPLKVQNAKAEDVEVYDSTDEGWKTLPYINSLIYINTDLPSVPDRWVESTIKDPGVMSRTGGCRVQISLKRKGVAGNLVKPSRGYPSGSQYTVVKDGVLKENFIDTRVYMWPMIHDQYDSRYDYDLSVYVAWAYYYSDYKKKFNGGVYVGSDYIPVFSYAVVPESITERPFRVNFKFGYSVGDFTYRDEFNNTWFGFYHPYCSTVLTNGLESEIDVISTDGGEFHLRRGETKEIYWYATDNDELLGGIKIKSRNNAEIVCRSKNNSVIASNMVDGWYEFPICKEEMFVNRKYIDYKKYNLATTYSLYEFRPLLYDNVWWMFYHFRPLGMPVFEDNDLKDTTVSTDKFLYRSDMKYDRFADTEKKMFYGGRIDQYDSGGGQNNEIYGGAYVFLGDEGDDSHEGSDLFVRFQYRDDQSIDPYRYRSYEMKLSQSAGNRFKITSVSGFEWLVSYIPLCRIQITNISGCDLDIKTPDDVVSKINSGGSVFVSWFAEDVMYVRGGIAFKKSLANCGGKPLGVWNIKNVKLDTYTQKDNNGYEWNVIPYANSSIFIGEKSPSDSGSWEPTPPISRCLISRTGACRVSIKLKDKVLPSNLIYPTQCHAIREDYAYVRDGVNQDNFIDTKMSMYPIWGDNTDTTNDVPLSAYVVWAYYQSSDIKRFNGGLYVKEGYKVEFSYVVKPYADSVVPPRCYIEVGDKIGSYVYYHSPTPEIWDCVYHPLCTVLVTNGSSTPVEIITPDGSSFKFKKCETKKIYWYATSAKETFGGFSVSDTDGSMPIVKNSNGYSVYTEANGDSCIIPESPSRIFINSNPINIYKYSLRTTIFSLKYGIEDNQWVYWIKNGIRVDKSYVSNVQTLTKPIDSIYNKFGCHGENLFYGVIVKKFMSGSDLVHGGIYIDMGDEKKETNGNRIILRYVYEDAQFNPLPVKKLYNIDLSQEVGLNKFIYGVSSTPFKVSYIVKCSVEIENGDNCDVEIRTPDGAVKKIQKNSSMILDWVSYDNESTRGMYGIRQLIPSGKAVSPLEIFDKDNNSVEYYYESFNDSKEWSIVPYSPKKIYINKRHRDRSPLILEAAVRAILRNSGTETPVVNIVPDKNTVYGGDSGAYISLRKDDMFDFVKMKNSGRIIKGCIPWVNDRKNPTGCLFADMNSVIYMTHQAVNSYNNKQVFIRVDEKIGDFVVFGMALSGEINTPRTTWDVHVSANCGVRISNLYSKPIEVKVPNNDIKNVLPWESIEIKWSANKIEDLYGPVFIRSSDYRTTSGIVSISNSITMEPLCVKEELAPVNIRSMLSFSSAFDPNDGWIEVSNPSPNMDYIKTPYHITDSDCELLCANDGSMMHGTPMSPIFGKATILAPVKPLPIDPSITGIPLSMRWYTDPDPYEFSETEVENPLPNSTAWYLVSGAHTMTVCGRDKTSPVLNKAIPDTSMSIGGVIDGYSWDVKGDVGIATIFVSMHYSSSNDSEDYEHPFTRLPDYVNSTAYEDYWYDYYIGRDASSVMFNLMINTDKDEKAWNCSISRGQKRTINVRIDIKTHMILDVS